VGNVIPTGSVFCLLGILRMSYVHTVKEYKIVQENTYALLKPILSVLGPSLRNDTSNDTWCICWCYCTILPSRPSTSALVTPRRRGDVRNNSRMLPSSAGRSMRNAPRAPTSTWVGSSGPTVPFSPLALVPPTSSRPDVGGTYAIIRVSEVSCRVLSGKKFCTSM